MRHIAIIAVILAMGAALLYSFEDLAPVQIKDQAGTVTSADEAQSFQLSNGMEVVLAPNHRVPAVSHTLWLRVGAADDPAGKSGLAHYLEHLIFKGTPTHPEGDYERIISERGGQFNAFTGADFTGYYVNIAKEHLPLVMELEADRMQHLKAPEDSFAREREVIIEERRARIENSPGALLDEQLRASLFRHHPYRIPIIGWMHEMKELQADDAKRFYTTNYNIPNMILVVSGDITRDELQPLAEKYYGTIKPVTLPARHWTDEPPQNAARSVTLRHVQVRQPRLTRYYSAPSYVYGDTKQALPLEVLSYWFGGGKTSLLYRTLVVEKRMADAASASYTGLTRGPSLFSISVTPADGTSMEAIEAEIATLISKVSNETIDDESLKRAKTLMKADAIYARDGLQTVAQILGYLRALGLDLTYFTEWTRHVDTITADQVRDAAKHVLLPENSVTGYLLPAAAPAEASAQPESPATKQGDANETAVSR